MSDSQNSYEQLKKARLRLEGGGELSEDEHRKIDTLNVKLAIAVAETDISTSLAMQSLSEMLISAIGRNANTSEEFMKAVYTFMKDYWFIQAEKSHAIIMQRQKEFKEELKNPNGIVSQLEKMILGKLGDDQCNCDTCIERRSKESTLSSTTPNPNTKH